MQSTAPSRNVALLIETSNRHGRDIVAGVHAFAREQGSWILTMAERGRNETSETLLHPDRVDGAILRVECEKTTKLLERVRIPTVTLSSVGNTSERVCIAADCDALTRLAAEHLYDQGFRQFAFFGDAALEWSLNRGHSFARFLADREFGCHVFQRPADKRRNGSPNAVVEWILQLPKPVGIMAADDMRARQLLDLCHQLGLRVPDEVAVIGVDNDELFCTMCEPPLSSIVLNGRQTGYDAASLLNDMLNGRGVPRGLRSVPPLGVVPRRSTESAALENELIGAAMRFIREHVHERITVDDVAQAVNTSRRTLERHCRRALDGTVSEQIQRTRISLVQQLLISTDHPLRAIALRTGFDHPEYLSVAFKRLTGITPSAYRRQWDRQNGELKTGLPR